MREDNFTKMGTLLDTLNDIHRGVGTRNYVNRHYNRNFVI